MRSTIILCLLTLIFGISTLAQKATANDSELPAGINGWVGEDSDRILDDPIIKKRLQKLLGEKDYASFMEYFETRNPIEKKGFFIFSSGCMIHACLHLESAIAIDPQTGTIHAAIYDEVEKTRYFNEKGRPTPEPLTVWAARLESLKKPGQTKKTKKNNNSIETQIIALEKQAWEQWKNGNRKFVENYLADDAFFVYPEGVINKSQIAEAVGSCRFNSYSLEDFRFKMLDKNAALVTYTANQDIVCSGQPAPKAVRSTSVYVKRNGTWLSTFYTETAEVQTNTGEK